MVLKGAVSGLIITASVFNVFSVQTEKCTSINAVTSASQKFDIKSGSQYCATTAKLTWVDDYNNGTRSIEWGTSVQYGKKSSLTGKSGTVSIENLQPNTKYYWRVNRFYEGKSSLTPAGSFTTTDITAAIHDPIVSPVKNVPFQLGEARLHFSYHNEKEVVISLFTLNGTFIARQKIELDGDNSNINIPGNNYGTGALICKISSGSKMLFNSVIMKH